MIRSINFDITRFFFSFFDYVLRSGTLTPVNSIHDAIVHLSSLFSIQKTKKDIQL